MILNRVDFVLMDSYRNLYCVHSDCKRTVEKYYRRADVCTSDTFNDAVVKQQTSGFWASSISKIKPVYIRKWKKA